MHIWGQSTTNPWVTVMHSRGYQEIEQKLLIPICFPNSGVTRAGGSAHRLL
jgi:hypothetical protein